MKEFIINLLKKIPKRTVVEIIVGAALLLTMLTFLHKYNHAQEQLVVSANNNAAYQMQLENAETSLIQYQFTVDQLNHFNDSVSNKLKDAIRESGVKEKKIQELQYMLSHFEKHDTVKLTDTIFREPDFAFDTTIGDEWINTMIHMEYPSTIQTRTSVKSEKNVIIHTEKETLNPPAKFFLCRWFQRKVRRVRVEVQENNPYITSTQSVFIKTEK